MLYQQRTSGELYPMFADIDEGLKIVVFEKIWKKRKKYWKNTIARPKNTLNETSLHFFR
jgi:hypothetical protein